MNSSTDKTISEEQNTLWQKIQNRFDLLSKELTESTVDPKQRHIVQKELSQLTTILELYNKIVLLQNECALLTKQLSHEHEPEMLELYQEEITHIQATIKTQQEELDAIMYPPDPFDTKNVFLEIRAGTGGQEAALFAGDLLKMYTNYALSKNWHAQIVSMSETDLGGFKEIVLEITGDHVYGALKFESGVHRVQRVPQTE